MRTIARAVILHGFILFIITSMATTVDAQTYGSPLGRIYLSFDPASEQTCANAPTYSVTTLYVLADIDFGDIGQPARNASDGLVAWECSILMPSPASSGLHVLSVNYFGGTNWGQTEFGVLPGFDRVNYYTTRPDCGDVSSGTLVLAEIELVKLSSAVNEDLTFTLAPSGQKSSFASAPGGDAPGWIECQPFQDIRHPFTNTGSTAVLNPSATTIPDFVMDSVSISGNLDANCDDVTLNYGLSNAGCGNQGDFEASIWLSDDATITSADMLLQRFTIPAMGFDLIRSGSVLVSLPPHSLSGTAYVGMILDEPDLFAEPDESNNALGTPITLEGPAISSILDVRPDQGQQVRLNFAASSRDAQGSPTPVLQYEAFRRIEGPSKQGTKKHPLESLSAATPGFEFVGSIPAHGEMEYNMLVPTLSDSTAAGNALTGFFVRAATSDPLTYFDSCVHEGYSVDNLSPGIPKAFSVAYAAGGNTLNWDESEEPDFAAFRVYRDTDPGFDPGPQNLVLETVANTWFDTVQSPWTQNYKLSAVDLAGNESLVTEPGTTTAVEGDRTLPARFSLHRNVPNPFNPRTEIAFEIPRHDTTVRLSVYDAFGRLVRELVEGALEPGTHRVVWDGRGRRGTHVSSGVYYYRLEAGNFQETRKMLLVR